MKIVNNLIEKINNYKNLKIIKTIDGSNSIHNLDLDEIYHSRNGAIQESFHVFILNGLKKIKNKKKIKILEVGMGTGLNVLLTFLHSKSIGIEYHALEPFPLNRDILSSLNYSEILSENKFFNDIHNCSFNKLNDLSKNFSLIKYKQEFLSFNLDGFDLIYYDAFSPRAQKEMWEISNFKKAFSILNTNGFLTTYCAKGSFKRDLEKVGFFVFSPPGPFGKREITNAFKN